MTYLGLRWDHHRVETLLGVDEGLQQPLLVHAIDDGDRVQSLPPRQVMADDPIFLLWRGDLDESVEAGVHSRCWLMCLVVLLGWVVGRTNNTFKHA